MMPNKILVFLCLAMLPAGAQQLLPGERETRITEIPGVIDGGARWKRSRPISTPLIGIAATPDGDVMFAQEQIDKIIKLDANHKAYTVVRSPTAPKPFRWSQMGVFYAVQRACTEPLNAELAGMQ